MENNSIDFAVITIRLDEFKAVHRRFSWTQHEGERHTYFITNLSGKRCLALVNILEAGNSRAQQMTADLIHDLNPKWIFLVGIGGGFPDDEYSLGDVLLATRVESFAVRAAIEGKLPELNLRGSRMHPEAERILESLPGMEREFGQWNSSDSIGMNRPKVNCPSDLCDERLYGSDSWKRKVMESLQTNHLSARRPRFYLTASLDGNILLKDASRVELLKQVVRDSGFAEMEIAGVMLAARDRPVLSIRGLSDIVGFKRSPEWTAYACETAAALLAAIVSLDLSYKGASAIAQADESNLSSGLSDGVTLLQELLLGCINETVGKFSDDIYQWRYENRIALAKKTDKILKENEVANRIVPPSFLLPLLEAASDVDEPELQEMWARLLAGAVEKKAVQQPSYINALKELSCLEAKLLNSVAAGTFSYSQLIEVNRDSNQRQVPYLHPMLGELECSKDELFASISHLHTLGLILPKPITRRGKLPEVLDAQNYKERIIQKAVKISVTAHGKAFLQAVTATLDEHNLDVTDGWEWVAEVEEFGSELQETVGDIESRTDDMESRIEDMPDPDDIVTSEQIEVKVL